ncbi:polymorphic toxin-type HINT domain-containing protein [Micromonospora sp. DR5-3]|uniref:polymorphic toxin-type HINT domain-containing protein n=1 Tax=unclassified Micromonospora TaxID=2617518 RepID=UPI0016523FF3|nr:MULTISPECIES: polymorphic toxin-type HINT domain-containing protein [unclassified Micromonospora]MCW3816204.1 polymorphic toxin-type HINT domain-containing protein [Micromonospora sp. DR5-3]
MEVLPKAQAQAAGVNGLLVRIGRTDGAASAGQVEVNVDYSAFATAYGADWSSRLRLVRLPDCALTTPGAKGCEPTPLDSQNHVRMGTVSATVTASPVRAAVSPTDAKRLGVSSTAASAGTLVALTSGPSGGAGDFTASSLAPASSWGHSGATGSFQWSYPMRTPPGPGGPSPSLGLSYSSQSVDGRQAATNNQPGAFGEGFDYSPGFIERRYKPCADDMGGNANNTTKTGDLCWGPDNALLSLGGSSVELLKGSDGKWHPRNEDGSKIELLTTPDYGNYDNDNEYWKLTTTDGTQYWFGRHQLPGWSSGRPTTNSVLTVPVYGNNPGEPCYASTFAASDCGGKKQAWRWNLDYVQDIHGNTMSFWWTKETNYYAKNKVTATPVVYDRGAYLKRIDYGTDNRDNTEYAATSPYIENVPVRVDFTNLDRCLANCTTKNATTWPDTPWDQECTATTNPCLNAAPTFWSAKRTTVITTKVWKAATSSYQAADSWTFRHSFLDPGDGTRAGLWLEGITHRGLNGTTVTAPEVTFSGIQMQNRVDASGSDWALAMNWWRVNSIKLETGGEIFVTYSPRQCAAGSVIPTALDSNTLRCYPVKWTPQGYTDPITDYFHKYVVTEVQQIDHTGGARPLRTAYEYVNTGNEPLWHYDEDTGITPDSRRSWSQWRGYPTVITYVGEGAERTKTETLYYRGMYGDKLAAGGTRTTQVQGREGGATNDYDHFAGTPRERIQWLGSTVIAATVNDMWRSSPTATRSGTPIAEARYSRVGAVHSRAATDTVVRRRTTTYTFDSYGMPTSVEDGGDDAKTGDEGCVQTEYARNTADWLLTPVRRVHGWADRCATAPTAENQITADTRFSFDSLGYGAAPTDGLVTAVETIKSFSGGTRAYQQVSTTKYDPYGRVKETTDIAGETTTTDYTPSAGGPVTQMVTTNPLLWKNTVDLDPAFGVPVKTTDPNDRITEISYDAMGRATSLWLPNRPRATYPSAPSTSYSYNLSKTAPSSITTTSLNSNGTYDTSYTLLDALGRPRQTQEAAYGTGRILTDTFYDAAGRIYKANASYYDSGAIDTSIIKSRLDQDVPSQTRTLYDTAGRPIHSILFGTQASVQVEKARTSTTYSGDHTTVVPPEGDSASTIWTDAHGRVEKLRQYHGHAATGTYDETSYTYHPVGQLATVKDASGNTWSYSYDIQGRLISSSDPDNGTSTLQYNTLGDLEKTTDSRPDTPDLWYTYDRMGRLDTVRESSLTGAKRISYTYDLPVKGVTKSASRWIGNDEYRSETITVDTLYRPTQTKLTLPSSQAGFCGIGAATCSFTSKASFLADGSPNTVTLPAAGGLSQEILTYKYDSTYAMPDKLATDYGDATHYVVQSGYTNLYELSTLTRATALTGAKSVQTTNRYDESTGRVTSSAIIRSTSPAYIANTFYDYDASGNILKIDDNSGARPRDTQCFTYDHQRRLTEAWTPLSFDCNTKPQTEEDLGGPAPYWQQWSFGAPDDPKGRIGNRLTQTERGTPTGTVTTTYSYPAAGAAQPHRLDGWSRTDDIGTTTGSYTYDEAGNTKTRPGKSGQQTLTWDVEGHLASVTDSTGTSSYIYDAAGNRLIATDPTGSTLFLGDQEVRKNASNGQVDATRYYSFNGETIAQRTVTGITWLASDHQGTSLVSVGTDTNQTITQRRQTPYGTPRGAAVSWPNQQGFLGGYQDPTGLTHLGAREYDPTIGRFISVDPINDPGNPQQMPAYTYAANNPVTFSDPSGEIIPEYANPSDLQNLSAPCWAAGKGGYACQDYMEEGNLVSTRVDPGLFNNPALHDMAGYVSAVPIIGTPADIADAALYAYEGDWKMAAIAILPGPPICKFAKSLCKETVQQGAKKAERALGEEALERLTPKMNPRKEAEEFAKIKADARAKERAAVNPKTPPTPEKKPDPGTKGKPPTKNVEAPPKKSGCEHSFDPSTHVLMADGSTRPIANVAEGDKVLAHDPETGDTTAETVEALHINQDEDLTDLSVRTKDGKFVTLKTTQHHPFWSDSRNEWINAGDLQATEWLKTASGEFVTVAKVHNYRGYKTMRDLTVSDIHTYYVLAGGTPVLVHNCNKNQGVYIFDDASKPGHVYVGQTNNFTRRFGEHMGKGRLNDPKDAVCIHVCGSADDLKVMEYIIKDQLQEYGFKLSSPIEPNTRNVYNSLRRFVQKPLFRLPEGES